MKLTLITDAAFTETVIIEMERWFYKKMQANGVQYFYAAFYFFRITKV